MSGVSLGSRVRPCARRRLADPGTEAEAPFCAAPRAFFRFSTGSPDVPAWMLAAGAVLLGAAPAVAIDVVSTDPAPYALAVSRTLSEVSITFDAPPVLPGDDAVRVAGYMSGLHEGTVAVDGNTVTFTNVSPPFMVGELVFVNLHRDITDGGASLVGGHFHAFTIESGLVGDPVWSDDDRLAFPTSQRPYFIHGGDLDGDGTPDIALPNEDENSVSIGLNNLGSGDFSVLDDSGVGVTPSSIFGEDFDNDGDQDLATADIASSTMSVLLNNGDGTFAPAVTYSAGNTTRQIHGGDFDGDNDVDLCTTSTATDRILLWFNDGNGNFGVGVPYTNVGDQPFAIRTGDVDGDGWLDIGVANQGTDNLSVLRNQGGGSFTTIGSYGIGNLPWCLNGNDFDGDGDFDFVSVASAGNRLVVLINNGNGQYLSSFDEVTQSFPLGVYCADLDGDGDIDATSSNFSGRSVEIFMNAGTGNLSFHTRLNLPRSGTYTWAHDLDGDGDLDISTLDELEDEVYIYLTEDSAVSVESPVAPSANGLLSAIPNPLLATRGAILHLEGIPADARALVAEVYAVDGRRVRRLLARPSGTELDLRWDGRDAAGRAVPAGAYVIRVKAGDFSATHEVRVIQ